MRKILLLGPAESGKTAFFCKVAGKTLATEYKSTIGVDMCVRRVNEQKLLIWDTSGQERFDTIVMTYLRDASLVYVFCDTTKTDDSLSEIKRRFSLSKLREQAGAEAKFILVASKLVSGASIPEKLKGYAREEGYDFVQSVDANAKDGKEQCDALFNAGLSLLSASALAPAAAIAYAAAPAPAPAPNFSAVAELKAAIQAYIDRRGCDSREYYSWGGVGRFFGGVSKTQKLQAASALLGVINGELNPICLSTYKTAGSFARGSELGKLYFLYSPTPAEPSIPPAAGTGIDTLSRSR